MKKLMLIFICLIISSHALKSQEVSKIFTSKKATWYGLDFSKVKLIGSEGFTDALKIKNVFFSSWNNLIINEPAKYNLQLMFHKDTVFFDLSVVEKRNKLPEVDELVINNDTYSLDKSTIDEIIKKYNTKEKEGLGIVFIMESFDKPKRLGTMWVTFFDIASKTVLLTEKMSGKPEGAGFRNYWARTYYNVMAKIKKTEYLKWETEYNK
ncbi:MAG: hypothetical protein KAV44_03415 [Bacteroidales bacterium]|nr:hypothetical protein [Bacteroidales bacterium]